MTMWDLLLWSVIAGTFGLGAILLLITWVDRA